MKKRHDEKENILEKKLIDLSNEIARLKEHNILPSEKTSDYTNF